MSIANLKKSKQKRLENLQKKIQEDSKKSYSDDRFWNLTMDKDTKAGKAIIRFIPSPEQIYEKKLFSHSFQNKETKKWFIETCPTTVYGDREFHRCPVCESRGKALSAGESEKDKADMFKRKIHYVSNIYVVKDYANPENDGKVFLFKYGTKIHDKIAAMVAPEYEDEAIIDVFDFWDGRDFTLKSKAGQGGWVSYDDSSFGLNNCFEDMSDEELDEIFKKTYSLQDLYSEEKLTSYENMKKNFERVIGESSEVSSEETKKKEEKVEKKKQIIEEIDDIEIEEASSDDTDDIMSQIDDLLAEVG